MPIFEYQCQSCGHVSEVLQKSSKAPKPVCPSCSGKSLKKLLSGFAVGQSKPSVPASCEACPSQQCMGGGPCPSMG